MIEVSSESLESAIEPGLFWSRSRRSRLHRRWRLGFLLSSRLAPRALGFSLLTAPRLFNSALDVHSTNSRTLARALEGGPIRQRAGVGLSCAIGVALEMAERLSPEA